MKKYSKRSPFTLVASVIALAAVSLASWGLYTTYFAPGKAAEMVLRSNIDTPNNVYATQPFTASGKIIKYGSAASPTPSPAGKFTGPLTGYSLKFLDSASAVVGTYDFSLNADGTYSVSNVVIQTAGKYRKVVYYLEKELKPLSTNPRMTVRDPIPMIATLEYKETRRIQFNKYSKTEYKLSGTINKFKTDGTPTWDGSSLTFMISSASCPSYTDTQRITRTVKDGQSSVGKIDMTVALLDGCGDYSISLYKDGQWVEDAMGGYITITIPGKPTTTPTPRPTT